MATGKYTQRTKDVRHLIELISNYGYTQSSIQKELGLGAGTVSYWLKNGDAPIWTLAAAEHLKHKVSKEEFVQPVPVTIFVISEPKPERAESLRTLCDGLGFKYTEFTI